MMKLTVWLVVLLPALPNGVGLNSGGETEDVMPFERVRKIDNDYPTLPLSPVSRSF